MAQTKASIFLELHDKFSKNFTQFQSSLKNSEKNTNTLSKSLKSSNSEFSKGSKEIQKYNNNFNNFKNGLKEVSKVVLPAIAVSKLSNIIKGNLAEAGNRQMLGVKLSTVIGSNSKEEFIDYFKQIERTGIATFQEIVDTGYNLLSAGLNGDQAKLGAKKVIEVATVTGGDSASVASIMAGASQNFKQEMGKVGDILTKTQLKFKFANFAQLGEGFANVASRASAMGLSIEQTATALGVLNNADISGGRAGTALSAVLRSLPKVTEKLNLSNPYDENGQLDFLKFVKEVDKKTKGLGRLEKASLFQELFGDEGMAGFLPLLAKLSNELENYDTALQDVTQNSKDVTDNEMLKYYDAYNTKVSKLRLSLTQLSAALGERLLPYVSALFDKMANGIGILIDLTDKNSAFAWGIYGVIGALGLLASSMLIIKTLGFLNMLFGFTKAFALLKTAILITAGAVKTLTLAIISNPIGALLVALMAGAIYVVTHWEQVKSWFLEFFNWLENSAVFKMLQKGLSVAAEFFTGTKETVKISNDGVNKVKEISQSKAQSGSNVTNNQKIDVTINAQAGMSEEAIAEAVIKEQNKQSMLNYAN